MNQRRIILFLICLCSHFVSNGQVWRVQLPFLYGAQGWQTSGWDQATENRFNAVRRLGLVDIGVTAKNKITFDVSLQLESRPLDYVSLPEYLEHADLILPERQVVMSNLRLGTTSFYRGRDNDIRLVQFKVGLAKNWWFEKWSLDLGAKYLFYLNEPYRGTSLAFVSSERLYRLDRWSNLQNGALEFSFAPSLFLGNSLSLGGKVNWVVNRNVQHNVVLERLSGLDVPEEQYTLQVKSTEHLLYLGLGLYYTSRPSENKADKKSLKEKIRYLIYKY